MRDPARVRQRIGERIGCIGFHAADAPGIDEMRERLRISGGNNQFVVAGHRSLLNQKESETPRRTRKRGDGRLRNEDPGKASVSRDLRPTRAPYRAKSGKARLCRVRRTRATAPGAAAPGGAMLRKAIMAFCMCVVAVRADHSIEKK